MSCRRNIPIPRNRLRNPKARRTLRKHGYRSTDGILRWLDYRIESVVEQEAAGRLATVRVVRSRAPRAPVDDLWFASSGIEPEIVTEAEVLELLPRLSMRVATTGHLIALKVLSRDDVTRPQDLVDLRALLRVASEADPDRAQRALTLIAARGFHRGRDLIADMNGLLRT